MAAAEPYTIHVPDTAIADLKERLALARFPDELEESAWDLGAPLAEVKRLVRYWHDEYDWRKSEARLNEYPQFSMKIQPDGFEELDVHFIHQQSAVKGAIPLLFVHGWPGSYKEVTKLLPLLTAGGSSQPAFHVVAPSLPGFGWSAGTKRKGFGPRAMAQTLQTLMARLGYAQYVTQGGDLGFAITRTLGLLYPAHCLASHINMPRAEAPAWTENPLLAAQNALMPYSDHDRAAIARARWFRTEGSGYMAMHQTRPQTIGYALASSPVALLAWVYEKLHDWTDAYPWADDEVCEWMSVYWFSSAGPHASVRYYYERQHAEPELSPDRLCKWIPAVKLGLAFFPKEIGSPPRLWARKLGPVVFESEYEEGGHFAAWEKPHLLAKDLRDMFGKDGPCAGIIKNHSGYD